MSANSIQPRNPWLSLIWFNPTTELVVQRQVDSTHPSNPLSSISWINPTKQPMVQPQADSIQSRNPWSTISWGNTTVTHAQASSYLVQPSNPWSSISWFDPTKELHGPVKADSIQPRNPWSSVSWFNPTSIQPIHTWSSISWSNPTQRHRFKDELIKSNLATWGSTSTYSTHPTTRGTWADSIHPGNNVEYCKHQLIYSCPTTRDHHQLTSPFQQDNFGQHQLIPSLVEWNGGGALIPVLLALCGNALSSLLHLLDECVVVLLLKTVAHFFKF